jgi:hypothetical protein
MNFGFHYFDIIQIIVLMLFIQHVFSYVHLKMDLRHCWFLLIFFIQMSKSMPVGLLC